MMGLRAILAEVMTTMIARIATPIAARQTRIVGTATQTAVTIILPLTDIARIGVGRVITATTVTRHTAVIPVLREPMLIVLRIADHRTGIETGTMGLLTRRGDLPSIGPTKVRPTPIRTFTMGRLVITGVTRLTFRDKAVDRIAETSRIAAPTADHLIAAWARTEVSMAGVVGTITLLATRETTGDRNMDRLAPRGSSRSAGPIVVFPIAHKRIVVASTAALLAIVTLSVVRPTGAKKIGATIGTIADRLASIATTRPKSDSLAAASLLTSKRTRRASSL